MFVCGKFLPFCHSVVQMFILQKQANASRKFSLSTATYQKGIDNESMTSDGPSQRQKTVVDSAFQALQKQVESFISSDDADATNSSQQSLGRIQFTIWYDFTTSTLTLKIIQATDLPAMDKSGTSDPYVKVK
jgi:C2 domain